MLKNGALVEELKYSSTLSISGIGLVTAKGLGIFILGICSIVSAGGFIRNSTVWRIIWKRGRC